MKPILTFYILFALSELQAAAQEISLFNGRDLSGWLVPIPNHWWTVENQTIVGRNQPGLPSGSNLLTSNNYGDLRVEAEIRWSKNADTGIYLRKGTVWQCQIGDSASLKKDMTCSIYIPGKSYIRQAQGVQKLLRVGDWNKIRIDAKGNHYGIWLNNVQVLDTVLPGYDEPGPIGLTLQRKPDDMKVEFRSLRLTELTSLAPPPSAPLAMIQTDANQPRIEVIKDQGPNAAEWALTPLDEAIPADIRQNLTFLREDLLDEGKKAAKASPEAYKLASDYCDKLLAALDQRDVARANAGYAAAQADANKRTSTQALDARRNYKMSWPQFSREESQRAALRENETDKADVKKQRLKVEWTTRAVQMRSYLDGVYRQLREAIR